MTSVTSTEFRSERRVASFGLSETHAVAGSSRGVCCGQESEFEVVLEPGLLAGRESSPWPDVLLRDRLVLIVTTPTVNSLYGSRFTAACRSRSSRVDTLVLACSESTKTFDLVESVCRHALGFGIDRTGVLVALGGGVCSDVVTVAASMIRRGILHVRVPTTLVGQIDAGIGIKGAVNFSGKKSYLGTFYPPSGVLIDSEALRTLPESAISDGIAEMVKMAVVRSAQLFGLIESSAAGLVSNRFQCPTGDRLMALSIELMLQELEQNIYERETYKRAVDFGHTFSPLIEASCGYAVSHGVAVATDIALSCALAVELGLLSDDDFEAVTNLFLDARLPLATDRLSLSICRHALGEAERHRGGQVNLVVPKGIGGVTFIERQEAIPASALSAAVRRISNLSHTRDIAGGTR